MFAAMGLPATELQPLTLLFQRGGRERVAVSLSLDRTVEELKAAYAEATAGDEDGGLPPERCRLLWRGRIVQASPDSEQATGGGAAWCIGDALEAVEDGAVVPRPPRGAGYADAARAAASSPCG
mgnify:CR=1 FL=1